MSDIDNPIDITPAMSNAAVLRPLELADAVALAELGQRWESAPQLGEFLATDGSPDWARHYIEKHYTPRSCGVGIWVGTILAGIVTTHIANPHSGGLSYLLDKSFRGRGLMTRACASAAELLFRDIGCHRLETGADVANRASCAILERLGFQREGVRRQAAFYGTFYGDVAVYGIFASEWSPPHDALPWARKPALSQGPNGSWHFQPPV
jgi:RimJ/RimL family protein N-acetyltransferase